MNNHYHIQLKDFSSGFSLIKNLFFIYWLIFGVCLINTLIAT